MIKGVGIDIVYIPEMIRLINAMGASFVSHTFTQNEIEEANNRINTFEYYSERFAVKEALFKSISSIINDNFDLKKIETLNKANGQPYIHITPYLKKFMLQANISNFHVSISADKDYAIAYVIAEGDRPYESI